MIGIQLILNKISEMINRIRIVLVILTLLFSRQFVSQNNISYHDSLDPISYVNSELLHNRTTVINRQNYISHGFLLGIKGDSLILTLNNQIQSHSLKDLMSVSIDVESEYYKGFLMGTLIGVYAGSLALFQEENQPFAYLEDHENGTLVIFGIIFAFAGGGIGYLIEQSAYKDQVTFNFSVDERTRTEDISKFKAFLFKLKRENQFNITAQLSQVNTRVSELDRSPDNYYSITSFNLLRKLDITYDSWKDISVGAAISWYGEPSLYYNNYTHTNSKFIWIETHYDGVGYYLVTAYEPFSTESFHQVSWKVGLGFGVGTIDYKQRIIIEELIDGEYINNEVITNIIKNKLSALFYSHFNLYLFENLSVGISADYVYLNEKMNAIPELKLPSRDFGNYSVGVNLSIHF